MEVLLTKTGFVWEERFAWHDTGPLTALFNNSYIQLGDVGESPESKRRIRNLLDVAGISDHLHPIRAREASRAELMRCHTSDYIASVEALSAAQGGLVGPAAWIGPGGFATAALAAGGVIAAVESVVSGETSNVYALVRPPGHHAGPALGGGLCTFNNIAIGARHALSTNGIKRVAIIDWDAHHGNGTQEIFYEDASVLTISLHQEGAYPMSADGIADTGSGAGEGYNINIPFPPGTGTGAYLAAFDAVIDPAIKAYRPDLIMVACGLDAGFMDFSARLMVHAEGFREMTRRVKSLASSQCGERLVFVHEGGYSQHHTPFLALAVVEELCGIRSAVEDPLASYVMQWAGHDLQPHQAVVIEGAKANAIALSKRTAAAVDR